MKHVNSSSANKSFAKTGLIAAAMLLIITAGAVIAKERSATNRSHVSTTALTTGLAGSTTNYVAVPTANGYAATNLVKAATTDAANYTAVDASDKAVLMANLDAALLKDDAGAAVTDATLKNSTAAITTATAANLPFNGTTQAITAAAKDGTATAAKVNYDAALLKKTTAASSITAVAATTTNLQSAKVNYAKQNGGQAYFKDPKASEACSCSLQAGFSSTTGNSQASTMMWINILLIAAMGLRVLRIVLLMKKMKTQPVAASSANFDRAKNMAMFASFKAYFNQAHEKTMVMKANFIKHFQAAKTLLVQGIYNFMTQISWHFKANFGFPYGNRTLANFVASE